MRIDPPTSAYSWPVFRPPAGSPALVSYIEQAQSIFQRLVDFLADPAMTKPMPIPDAPQLPGTDAAPPISAAFVAPYSTTNAQLANHLNTMAAADRATAVVVETVSTVGATTRALLKDLTDGLQAEFDAAAQAAPYW
ncbi:MAG: hypothetical protein JWN03_4754 [Nocardia sp.]|uniref:hypothetical protein n=1 Tax=Nocardia sp. TaxID=1821 RepID=UPI0026025192|nr:hypothetical protein [Nocardia sp.]MCU1644479.1 hypothetical protein [Nocardia sp.]